MNICLSHHNILHEICQYLSITDIRAIASCNTTLRDSGHEVAYQLNAICYSCDVICETKLVLGMDHSAWWCEKCSKGNAWECMACHCYDTRVFTALPEIGPAHKQLLPSECTFVHRAGECVFGNCKVCHNTIISRMDAWISKNDYYKRYTYDKQLDKPKPIGWVDNEFICTKCVRAITGPNAKSASMVQSRDLMGDYHLAGWPSRFKLVAATEKHQNLCNTLIDFEYKREINPDFANILNVDQYSAKTLNNIKINTTVKPVLHHRNSSLVCGRCKVAYDDYRDVRYIGLPIVQDVKIEWEHHWMIFSDTEISEYTVNDISVSYLPQPLINTTGLYCVYCLKIMLFADRYGDASNNTDICVSSDIAMGDVNNDTPYKVDKFSSDYSRLIYTRIHHITQRPKYNIDCVHSNYSYDSDDGNDGDAYYGSGRSCRVRRNSM
jgi:hypothetical protein